MHSSTRFTLTTGEWDVMVAALHIELVEIARQKRIVTYSDLALMLPVHIHPGSYTFTRLLTAVCIEEERLGHGLLCALVVSKATGMPGTGFFRGAAERGYDPSEPESYWREEVERVFAYWDGK